jgi:uncharacterized membrane protein
MYSRSRFDAFTDGVFSVAMTLLVVDVRLPDALPLGDAAAFVAALRALEPKLLAYGMSFAVVGASWLAKVTAQKRPETLGRPEALLTLVYLFLVTLTPFSTMALGTGSLRSGGDVLPAVWIYCGNLGAMGLVTTLIPLARRAHAHEDAPLSIFAPLCLLIAAATAAALASAGWSHWPYAFLIIALGGLADRRAQAAAKG